MYIHIYIYILWTILHNRGLGMDVIGGKGEACDAPGSYQIPEAY